MSTNRSARPAAARGAISRAALAIAVGSAAACGTDPAATPTIVVGSAPALSVAGPTKYSGFAADVSNRTKVQVLREGAPSALDATRTYHIAATRGPNGKWTTILTLAAGVNASQTAPGSSVGERDIGRIELGEGLARPRYYLRTGEEFVPGQHAALDALGAKQRGTLDPKIRAAVEGDAPASSGGVTDGWLQAFVARSEDRGTRRSALERRFGPATRRSDGRELFASALNGGSVEITIDPTTGDIGDVTISGQRNGVSTQLRYTMEQVSAGVFARATMRKSYTTRDGAARVTTETHYANVKLLP